jgi:signal recognition particle subunit SRP19
MPEKDKYVLWPIYFDRRKTRKNGRRVTKDIAVPNASADEIVKAAKKLELNPVKENKAYPGRWWKREGQVLVDKAGSKTKILRNIALEMSKAREN